MSLYTLSYVWGVPRDELLTYNPGIEPMTRLPVGTPIVVFSEQRVETTQSIGAPNQGRLDGGVPMPEGPSWSLRLSRRRVYGTRLTIETLVDVFMDYARRFPSAPNVRVGDISRRGGDYIAPHRSHQSGRDVDLAYVLHPREGASGFSRWRRTTMENFDGEKNWFLVSKLIDSGNVQTIFMGEERREQLYEAALAERPPDEVARYFEKISPWGGHSHHMHVRFVCEPDDARCRSNSVSHRADEGDDEHEHEELFESDALGTAPLEVE